MTAREAARTAIAMSKRIQLWPLDRLKPYEKNPRTHSSEQVAQLAAMISRFGFTDPLLVDGKRGLIAGHLRLEAARSLNLPRVPVIELTHLSRTEKRAFIMAHNRIALSSGWDEALLRGELTALQEDEFDLELTGFSDEEVARLLAEPEADEDEPDAADVVVDVPANPVTRSGDLWKLGAHRLLCGDSTKGEHVRALVGAAKVDMVFTDPPYAIYGSSTGISSDITDDKMVRPFFRDVLAACVETCRPFAHVYVCCDWRSWPSWWEVAKGTGIMPKNMIVWEKGGGLGVNYQNAHELLLFAWYMPLRQNMTQKMSGGRQVNDVNIWKFPRVAAAGSKNGREHNAQKPVGLVERAIANSSAKGGTVLDLFGGAGTTLVAAERQGRTALTMEIDPRYCDVTVRRWQELSGKAATRASDGRPFDELEAARPRRQFRARQKGVKAGPRGRVNGGDGRARAARAGASGTPE